MSQLRGRVVALKNRKFLSFSTKNGQHPPPDRSKLCNWGCTKKKGKEKLKINQKLATEKIYAAMMKKETSVFKV